MSVEVEEELNLGACCSCGCTEESVQNIICLPKKTPVPGTGWGCLICHLPYDGAIAVVCDTCLNLLNQGQEIIKQAVSGYATESERCDIGTLTEDFNHLDIPHE